MGKKKSIGGRPCKKKRAGSQIASKTELVPLDGPANTNIQPVFPEPETTGQVQASFPDRVYLLASVIFQNNHLEKPGAHRLGNFGNERGLPLPEVKGVEMQRTAYELAFSTLKCECLSDRWSSMDLIYLLPVLFFLLPVFLFLSASYKTTAPKPTVDFALILFFKKIAGHQKTENYMITRQKLLQTQLIFSWCMKPSIFFPLISLL